jgi:hypothetical protein
MSFSHRKLKKRYRFWKVVSRLENSGRLTNSVNPVVLKSIRFSCEAFYNAGMNIPVVQKGSFAFYLVKFTFLKMINAYIMCATNFQLRFSKGVALLLLLLLSNQYLNQLSTYFVAAFDVAVDAEVYT